MPVTGNEIFACRFVEGRIAEIWGVVDVLSQLRLLGLIPSGKSVAGGGPVCFGGTTPSEEG